MHGNHSLRGGGTTCVTWSLMLLLGQQKGPGSGPLVSSDRTLPRLVGSTCEVRIPGVHPRAHGRLHLVQVCAQRVSAGPSTGQGVVGCAGVGKEGFTVGGWCAGCFGGIFIKFQCDN